MDLRLSDDELAFRDEVRGFIRDRLPEDIRDRLRLGHAVTKSDIVRWQRILNEKGWAAYSWPKPYGGPGWAAVQRTIFIEEIQAAPAPQGNPLKLTMPGPVPIHVGTEEQKQRFLPRAAHLDPWWWQGCASTKKTRAGTSPNSCSATSAPASPGWANRRSGSNSPRRRRATCARAAGR